MSLSEAPQVLLRMPPELGDLASQRASAAGVSRVVLLKTQWYPEIMHALDASAREYFISVGVAPERIETQTVPGSFELPLAVAQLAESRRGRPNIVVALGCVVRGDTPHFDFVCQAVTLGLSEVQTRLLLPVGFGVLTVNTLAQAQARSGKGSEAAQAAWIMYLRGLAVLESNGI